MFLRESYPLEVQKSAASVFLYLEIRFTNVSGLVGKGWSLHKLQTNEVRAPLQIGAFRAPFYAHRVKIDDLLRASELKHAPQTLASFTLLYQIRESGQKAQQRGLPRSEYKMQDVHKKHYYEELVSSVEQQQIDLEQRSAQVTTLPRIVSASHITGAV